MWLRQARRTHPRPFNRAELLEDALVLFYPPLVEEVVVDGEVVFNKLFIRSRKS